MITQEEIKQQQSNIDEIFATGDRAQLYEAAYKLYKDTDNKYAYFLGACYLNNWGVEQDFVRASHLLTTAANNNDNYNYACYLAAIAYYRNREYKNAFDWFCKADEAGVRDSLALYADSAAGCALELWEEVRHLYLQSEVTQGAAIVKNYMAVAIDLYMQAGETAPETMSNALYCGFARMLILMYNMGTTGMLDMKIVAVDSLAKTVAGGFEAMQKFLDTQAHDETLAKCVIGAHFMDQHGAPLVAEYLRAFLALMESKRDHSAAAFYRARWHMKRIGQMRETEPDAQLVVNSFTDIDGLYRLAEHKYGTYAINMMRSGQLPDLQKSFVPGYVPAVESCENFMKMFNDFRNSAQQAPAQSASDKVGGFLKKFFKI